MYSIVYSFSIDAGVWMVALRLRVATAGTVHPSEAMTHTLAPLTDFSTQTWHSISVIFRKNVYAHVIFSIIWTMLIKIE